VQNYSHLVRLNRGIKFGEILRRVKDSVINTNSDSSETIHSLDSIVRSVRNIHSKLNEIKKSNQDKERFTNSILLSRKVCIMVTTIGGKCELAYSKRIYILFELNVLLDKLDVELSTYDFGVEVEPLLREIREKIKTTISDVLRYGKNWSNH
jgi:hypothetical protein